MSHTPPPTDRPLVGISSCLMGMAVRYDGQHRHQPAIEQWIASHVRLLPLCPESMAGMGIPRAPVNVIEDQDGVRVLGRDDPERDVTARLRTMGRIITRTYPNLCGYILQSRSPSCGAGSTPIYNADQSAVLRQGNGLLAEALLSAFPSLPVLEATQLTPEHIEPFLAAVQQRWQALRD